MIAPPPIPATARADQEQRQARGRGPGRGDEDDQPDEQRREAGGDQPVRGPARGRGLHEHAGAEVQEDHEAGQDGGRVVQRPGQERAGESGEQPADGEREERAGGRRDELPRACAGARSRCGR